MGTMKEWMIKRTKKCKDRNKKNEKWNAIHRHLSTPPRSCHILHRTSRVRLCCCHHNQTTPWCEKEKLWTTNTHSNNIPTTYRQRTDNVPTTYRQCIKHSFWLYKLQTIYWHTFPLQSNIILAFRGEKHPRRTTLLINPALNHEGCH